jgi:hypothetical protein
MVRANDQGSLFACVCLELDYRRTIILSRGGGTQEAQEP